jgi:hypothetical protein
MWNLSHPKKQKGVNIMKKIILGIITIMLAAVIFGCGKTASSVGSSGGGSSGGGGGGGGSKPNTPKTFSVQGKINLSKPDGAVTQSQEQFSVDIYSFNADTDISNVDIKYYARDNSYAITGIPAGDVYLIKAVKGGQLELSALVWGEAGENKTVNLTPVSTVTVEIVSANPVIQATLEAANENTDMSVITEIQNDIETYYKNDPAALAELTASVNAGDLDAAALPSGVISGVNSIVVANSRTLSVAVSPVGTGTVSPNGGVYLRGTTLRLKAVASAGYEFTSWASGGNSNPLEITLAEPVTSVTANFATDTGYAMPNSFTAQGSMAFNESGGIGIMAVNELISIKVSSFKTGDNFDFAKLSFTGNTYKVSNLPLGEGYVIEARRGGRARLRSLVWGTTDGETKVANLTPTSTVVLDFLEEIDFHNEDDEDDVDLAGLENLRQDVEDYYADPAHAAELASIIDVLNRGEKIAFDNLPDDIAEPFLRQAPEIADLESWEYDPSWDRGGDYVKDDGRHNYSKPADLNAGGLFTGVQLGQKDGKLYFMLKLNGAANPDLRYQLMVGLGGDRNITDFHISVQNNGSNWALNCHGQDGTINIDPSDIFLEIKDDLIIAGGVPLTAITAYLGTARTYTSQAGVAFTGWNYYDTDRLRVRF